MPPASHHAWSLAPHLGLTSDLARPAGTQFRQYFEAGQPPNAPESQLAAAAAAGLDVSAARAVLADRDAYADATRAKLEQARRAGVRSVPSFRIDGREVVTGAQSAEYWEHVLTQQLALQLSQ